jgi:hypothetical protein
MAKHSDREMIAEVMEYPYMQAFRGLQSMATTATLDASTLTQARKRPMILKKKIDVFSFMPSGAVHIKPDLISPQSPAKLPQAQRKTCSIPLGMPDQHRFSQKRRYPTKYIQPHPMLTCGRNPKPPTAFGPIHPQTRMERKRRLGFKHLRLLRSQIFEFF